jgi:cation diffusion facilitator family transporter
MANPSDGAPVQASARVVSAERDGERGGESTATVVVAFVANAVIAVAKTGAAMITGSASMLAEAVHSWADTGNEVFLLIADRRSRRPANPDHPLGHGREAYVWSMFAAIGLFAVGAGVSIVHGIQELFHPEPAEDLGIAYAVLAIAFVLEGVSFIKAVRQARGEAAESDQDVMDHVLRTSDPTLRAVVAEDAAALVGIVIAFLGVLAHQLTGSAVWDAVGSIAIGVLLAVVSIVLVDRNRRFLVGEAGRPELRDAVLRRLLSFDEIERVTYLRLEYVGPRSVYLVVSVDLRGDERETAVARRLDALEQRAISRSGVAGAVFTVSTPEEPSLLPAPGPAGSLDRIGHHLTRTGALVTEPDPSAPPAAGPHPQERATQPLPMTPPTTPLSSDTPFDVPRPPSSSDLAPTSPATLPYPTTQHPTTANPGPQHHHGPSVPPHAPSGYEQQHPVLPGQVVPMSHQQPYMPYGQPVGIPYGQGGVPYPPYGYRYVPPPVNGMAIAALVLGILWLYWLGSVLALIFGYIALAQVKKAPADAPQQGRGLAVAGVVLGWVGVAILLLPLLFFLVAVPMSGL